VAPCLPGADVTGRNDDGTYNGTFTIKIGPTTAAYTGKLAMEGIDDDAHSATMQAQGTDKRGQGGAKATIVSKLSPAGEGATRVEVVTDYHITGRLARFGRGGMIEDISERLLREFAGCLQSSLGQGPPAGAEAAEEQATSAPDTIAPPTDAAAPAPTEAAAPPTEAAAPAPTEGVPSPVEGPPPPVASAPPVEGPPPPVASAPPVEGLSLVGSVLLGRVRRNPRPLLGVIGALLFLRLLRRQRR
jgi:carbon monoxide dehydrogenase subunit G